MHPPAATRIDAADPAPASQRASAPVVTVIVRSMDRPYLAQALAAVAAQDHPALEVLVVDATGGRHGPLPDVAWRAGHAVRLVPSAQPLPRPHAADVGLAHATGEWFTFLDDDDTCTPDHVSALVAVARAHPQACGVYGRARLRGPEGDVATPYGRPFNRALMHVTPLFHWQAALIRTRVRDLGCRMDPDFEVCEDRDFVAQVAEHGDFVFAPELATFEFRPDVGTSGTGSGANRDIARLVRYDSLLRAKWAGAGAWHAERVAVRCRRAARALREGDVERADRLFVAVLEEYQDDPNALRGRGRAAHLRGDAAAAAQFETAAARTLSGSVRDGNGDALRAEGLPELTGEASARWRSACEEAVRRLETAEPEAAFACLVQASTMRCDARVIELLGVCCGMLVDARRKASLWAHVRRVCAASAGAAQVASMRTVVVIGDAGRALSAIAALARAGVPLERLDCRVTSQLREVEPGLDATTCVVFCAPGDVPLDGVEGVGPGQSIVLSRGDDPEAVVRALARLQEGWTRARLDHLTVSV